MGGWRTYLLLLLLLVFVEMVGAGGGVPFKGAGALGGWVGWWVGDGKVEEKEALRMSYCKQGVGGWVGGWVGEWVRWMG